MAEELYRPWTWKPPEGGVIGQRRIPRFDGYPKVSGKAVFCGDRSRPGMLYGKVLTSPYANAKIVSMDTSKAEALPGVKAVIRYDDPEIDWNGFELVGPVAYAPGTILPGYAFFPRQHVGAIVVADTEALCDRALELVAEGIEWEERQFILDPEEAVKTGAPLAIPEVNPNNNKWIDTTSEYGNVEKGLKDAENVIDFTLRAECDTVAGVEPFRSLAEWKGDELEVWAKSQGPGHIQTAASSLTGMARINVHTTVQGGIFGYNGMGLSDRISLYSIVAAKRVDRPVMMIYEPSLFEGEEDVTGTHNFKVGFNNDGKITAVKIEAYHSKADIAMKLRPGTAVPNISLHLIRPFVNRGWMSCWKHGAPACAVVNLPFNHVAAELGMDPTEVWLLNDGCEGEAMADLATKKAEQGFDSTRDSLKEIIEIGKQAISWDEKWHTPGTKILPNGKYHGIGFYAILGWTSFTEIETTPGIKIQWDGTVNILGRRDENGINGVDTYCQIVADEMGMKFSDVFHRTCDDPGFDFQSPGSSSGMVRNTPGLIRCARKAKQTLLELAVNPTIGVPGRKAAPAFFPDKKPEDLDLWNSEIFEKAKPGNKITVSQLIQRACTYDTMSGVMGGPFLVYDPIIPQITDKTYEWVRQCYFTEVEVDPETGLVEITKHVVVNDVGKAITPDVVNGQQYGGSYAGLSVSNTEAIYYDPQTGVRLNDDHVNYAMLTMNDIGPIDCHIVETGLGHTPYGICGIGESGKACTATGTIAAIYNAIGKWVDDIPTTPNKVLKALGKA